MTSESETLDHMRKQIKQTLSHLLRPSHDIQTLLLSSPIKRPLPLPSTKCYKKESQFLPTTPTPPLLFSLLRRKIDHGNFVLTIGP